MGFPKLSMSEEVHGWTIGLIEEENTFIAPDWVISTNSKGEYFVWSRADSEELIAWVETWYTKPEVVVVCCVRGFARIDYQHKSVGLGIFRPEV
jgi:hypothetical protein